MILLTWFCWIFSFRALRVCCDAGIHSKQILEFENKERTFCISVPVPEASQYIHDTCTSARLIPGKHPSNFYIGKPGSPGRRKQTSIRQTLDFPSSIYTKLSLTAHTSILQSRLGCAAIRELRAHASEQPLSHTPYCKVSENPDIRN